MRDAYYAGGLGVVENKAAKFRAHQDYHALLFAIRNVRSSGMQIRELAEEF